MGTFEFYQDQKVTAWDRIHFSVTAPDLETAKSKLEAYRDKEIETNEELGITVTDCVAQYETSEPMTVEENGGCSTLEMFAENGDDIMSNSQDAAVKTSFHCCVCGSINIQKQAWVDPNNNNLFINCDDDEGWCGSCEQHLKIIPHSELMADIEFWWQHIDNGEDREVITGLIAENYDPANDYQVFDIACDKIWSAKTAEEKIAIWKILITKEEDKESSLLICPDCQEEALKYAMIDADGTNLEEGYSCGECGGCFIGLDNEQVVKANPKIA